MNYELQPAEQGQVLTWFEQQQLGNAWASNTWKPTLGTVGFGKEYTRGALFVLLHLKRKTAKLIQCTDRPTKRDKGDVIGVIVNTPTLE